ncbi:unnamed protein product [Aphanomyces euteiches]|uniref:Uncharacterized protein n=1 Tax=Aphanomyces euteiches TaxID=100861 RepID=A0A6G0XRP9_9STRA|nr:hypothetical protein Ae201684_002080 [Aphanomyces euteiches]KAH9086603.1 hypothetical protein Ae201684P_000025 [Aphanomyces euteiches]KAH9154806.1 hypothetical protein AeRB84_003154 [Aphanomyces euteiches]
MFIKSAIVAAFAVFLVWLMLPVTQFSGDHGEIIRGQNVIVTGASQGIGKALAFEYAKRGAAQIVITSRSEVKLTAVKDEINLLYPNATIHVVPADLSSEENSKAFVVAALTALNQTLDVLVLNHILPSPYGYWLKSPQDHSVLSQLFHTNTFSHIWVATAIVEALAPRGWMIQIGVVNSLASQMGVAKSAPYSASKHALYGFFNAFRAELSILGIHNVVITQCMVGTTDTEGAAVAKNEMKNVHWDAPEVTATGIARGIAFQKREIYQPHDFIYPALKLYQLAPWAMEEIFKSMLV